MTSILKVSEIQDPTNSNTAISIDAAGKVTAPNLVMPAGSVVQVKQVNWTQTSSTSSSSFVSMGEIGSITTTVANSKILVTTNIPLQLSSSNNSQSRLELRNSLDSYTGYLEHHVVIGYQESSGGYAQEHLGWNTLHDAQQPAGTTISYRTYFRVASGNGGYYIDAWGASPNYKCTLMEIAQ